MEEERGEHSFIKSGEEFLRHNPLFLSLLGVGFLLLAIGVFQYLAAKNTKDEALFIPSGSKETVAGATTRVSEISVDIEGGVQKPGVYKLREGARIQDALIVAGGMSSIADRDYVSKHFNLAQKLLDGAKVYIPEKGEQSTTVVSVEQYLNPKDTTNSPVGDNTGLININSATVDELDTLPKVGPVTAQKIISARPFSSKDELVSKKVMTQKTFEGLRDKITAE